MTIRKYHRAFLPGYSFISFHKNLCYCSKPECGATKPRTTGFAIYFWRYIINIGFDRPKGCNAPF